jgi:hypothetical protein
MPGDGEQQLPPPPQQQQQTWARRRRGSLKRQKTHCGWQEYEDDQGNLFYYNENTGVSTWERPEKSFIQIANMHESTGELAPEQGAAVELTGQARRGGAEGEALKSPYRLESKVRLLEEHGVVGLKTADADADADATNDPDRHMDADEKKKKKKRTRKRVRPRLKTKMSIRDFRATAGESYIYTVWPCVSIILVVVMATIIVVLGLTSDAKIPTILGIDASKTNEWVILLSAISGGAIFANILLSCLCFRFKVCEKMSAACPTSSNKANASDGEKNTLDEYQQHLMAAKKHLEDKRMGRVEGKGLKRVDTWSVPKSSDLESDDLKAIHNKVKHLRDHEKSGHNHHHHGRAKRNQYQVVVDDGDEEGGGIASGHRITNTNNKKVHKHVSLKKK